MEKALDRLAGGGHGSGSGANAPSKGFQNLVKGIAEAKTKHVSIPTYSYKYLSRVWVINCICDIIVISFNKNNLLPCLTL